MPAEIPKEDIQTQAVLLADEARKTDPDITKIFWFPADDEVRLVEVATDMQPTIGRIAPFYFPPSLPDKLPALSGVAVIRAGEEFRIPLPAGWGEWSDARELK
jgi:hypothetical protein